MEKEEIKFSKQTGRLRNLRTLSNQITRSTVIKALLSIDKLDSIPNGYGQSTFYDLVYEGKRYPPKLAFGLAFEYTYGVEVYGSQFSAGDNSSCFITLRRLGFDIQEKGSLEDLPSTEASAIENIPTLKRTTKPKNKICKTSVKGANARVRKPTDWGLKNERDRKLGNDGELLVLNYEKEKLRRCGQPELALKVKHIAVEDEGAGYDIESYTEDGRPIYIEVKTTSAGEDTPFYITANELSCSEKIGQSYRVYRVYNFDSQEPNKPTSFYEIIGPLNKTLNLEPISYSALPL